MNQINILLIGLGYHARRIYYPLLEELHGCYNLRAVVDVKDNQETIEKYLGNCVHKPAVALFTNRFSEKSKELPSFLAKQLDGLILKHDIRGVIIATDPLYHRHYALWALKKGLSILMDKPITTHKRMSSELQEAKKLIKDYTLLKREYEKRKNQLLFSIVAQRRFHQGFIKVKNLLQEVFEKTNCPITSIQISHSDGQWRLPSEIIDIDYHSFNKGYGKCSHSGYHFFDIANYLIEATNRGDKRVDKVEIFTTFLRPLDFLKQLTLRDYPRFFKDFEKHNRYTLYEYNKMMKNYGEIDAFTNLCFKQKGKIMTLASVNLVHNGFSQRGNLSSEGRDLYKGNGRVRHETYTIEQGPFQCIHILSFQGKEIAKTDIPNYEPGGEYHFDIHVFRNDKLFPEWKNYEKISIADLQKALMGGYQRGHQEDARRFATIEFLDYLSGKNKSNYLSDFTKHENSVRILYGVYKSPIFRFKNKNACVRLNYA